VSWKGFDAELEKNNANNKNLAVGIIVELNPLHDGHIRHIRETRTLSGRESVVCVMSGNFVQRGEPAVYDKWRRTQAALYAGADIVIELPLPYVICGADYFARGAVGLLASTGIVDCLSFGSESGDIISIRECSRVLAEEPPIYKEALRKALDKGMNFAAARAAGLSASVNFGGIHRNLREGLFTLPNNGLGMEYCKALELLGNPMEVFTTHRKPGGPSAAAIRKKMHDKKEAIHLNDFSDIFRYLIIRSDAPVLEEGLHHRFRKYAPSYPRLTDLLAAVKTKRYTLTRLQRTAMQIILGVTDAAMRGYESAPPYIRVLGFRKDSAGLVGEMTRRARLPVLTSGAASDSLVSRGGIPAEMLLKEWEAYDIYRLAYAQSDTRGERAMPVVKV